jgi:hypothetical protein
MEVLKTNGKIPRIYALVENGIDITTLTNPKLPTVEHIPYENIKSDRFFYKHKSPMLLIASGTSLIIYLLILVDSLNNSSDLYIINSTWAVLCIAFLVIYFVWQPKVYFLKTFTGKFIKFKISKNESDIASFVETALRKRNEFVKLTFGIPNPHFSYDIQYSNFSIMLREGIITPEEYQKKIETLNNLFNQTAPARIFPSYSKN